MKTGRNDICGCGSGLKYKKCCLSVDEKAPSTSPSAIKSYTNYISGQIPVQSFTENDEPERYLGYDNDKPSDDNPFSHSVEGLCCMVTNITKRTQRDAQVISGRELPVGCWIVTNRTPASKTVMIDGPFKTMQDAYDFGRTKYNVRRYKAMQLA